MKIVIERNTLSDLISNVIGAVSKNHYIEVLRCLLIECDDQCLSITGSNIAVTITSKSAGSYLFKNNDEVDQRFICALDAVKLNSIVKNYKKGSMSLELKDGFVTVKQGRSTFKIKSNDASHYPAEDETSNEQTRKVVDTFSIECAVLSDLINKTQRSAAVSDVRNYLNGLCFSFSNNLKLYGTNGHTLSHAFTAINNQTEHSTIIAKSMIPLLLKILNDGECSITAYMNRVVFDINDIKLTCTVINEKTPDYDRLINSSYIDAFSVNKEQIMDAVRLAATLRDGDFFGVCFTKKDNVLDVYVSKENNSFDDCVEIESLSDNQFDMKLNVDYILNALSVIEGETVTFMVVDNNSTISSICLKTNEERDGLHIIMPMRN